VAWEQVLGYFAGAFITMSFIPQIWRLFKLKSAREISLLFTFLLLIGTAGWLSYGVVLDLFPVLLWNSISFVLLCSMLYAKLRYGKL